MSHCSMAHLLLGGEGRWSRPYRSFTVAAVTIWWATSDRRHHFQKQVCGGDSGVLLNSAQLSWWASIAMNALHTLTQLLLRVWQEDSHPTQKTTKTYGLHITLPLYKSPRHQPSPGIQGNLGEKATFTKYCSNASFKYLLKYLPLLKILH